jgi:hypothetical protein
MASTLEGLQRQIDALASFCDLRQLTVNLGKTLVTGFGEFEPSSSKFVELQAISNKFVEIRL